MRTKSLLGDVCFARGEGKVALLNGCGDDDEATFCAFYSSTTSGNSICLHPIEN